jgi:hypothetical protein
MSIIMLNLVSFTLDFERMQLPWLEIRKHLLSYKLLVLLSPYLHDSVFKDF